MEGADAMIVCLDAVRLCCCGGPCTRIDGPLSSVVGLFSLRAGWAPEVGSADELQPSPLIVFSPRFRVFYVRITEATALVGVCTDSVVVVQVIRL